MSDELRCGYGLLLCLVSGLWLWGYTMRDSADGLGPVVSTTRLVLFVILLCYVAYSITRVRKEGIFLKERNGTRACQRVPEARYLNPILCPPGRLLRICPLHVRSSPSRCGA